MKYLLAFLLLLTCSVSFACDNPACTCEDCTCVDCACTTGERVALPNDASKLTVTVFAKDAASAKAFLAQHPEINKYRAGNHFNLYTSKNVLTKTRYGNPPMPSAYVQRASGAIVAATHNTNCLFHRWRNRDNQNQDKQADEEQSIDEESDSEVTPPPADDGPNAWVLVGLGILAVVLGAGSKFYEEMTSK